MVFFLSARLLFVHSLCWILVFPNLLFVLGHRFVHHWFCFVFFLICMQQQHQNKIVLSFSICQQWFLELTFDTGIKSEKLDVCAMQYRPFPGTESVDFYFLQMYQHKVYQHMQTPIPTHADTHSHPQICHFYTELSGNVFSNNSMSDPEEEFSFLCHMMCLNEIEWMKKKEKDNLRFGPSAAFCWMNAWVAEITL